MKNENQEEITMKRKEEKQDSRLAKRLCYVLRYGAMKEGLEVYEGGFVDLQELMRINLMRHNTELEVIEEIDTSLSHRGAKRFERKNENEKTLVRAMFCRRFEKNPFHENSGVHTLLDLTLEYVSSNLDLFDLEDFPDEYLISSIIHRLKNKKKLNNGNLRQLLVPTLEHLDLDGLYVTEGTLKTIWISCPQLKVLSLKDCGYIVTDNLMEQLLKKLPLLESINLCACKHITDRTVKALIKKAKILKQLNLSWIKTVSEGAIIDLIKSCPNLEHLDIYDHKVSVEGREIITKLAKEKGVTIVLKGLHDSDVAPKNPCSLLPNFGKVWY